MIRFSATCAAVAALFTVAAAPKAFSDEHLSVSASSAEPPGGISRLISELSSSDYRTRESATRQLSAAGAEAVDDVARAAATDDLEVAFRAVRILQAMLESDRLAVESRAAAALESLAKRESTSVADLALDALSLYRLTQQDRAVAELRRLGAVIHGDTSGLGTDYLQVQIGSSTWRGTNDDLALLKRMPNLFQLSIFGVALDDESMGILRELPHVTSMNLFGAGISDAAWEELRRTLPNTQVECRKGAMLGVRGNPNQNGCVVEFVQPGTAAHQAGLDRGDQIVTFNDQPVRNFHELTSLISVEEPGENATLQIRRGTEIIHKTIALGQWE